MLQYAHIEWHRTCKIEILRDLITINILGMYKYDIIWSWRWELYWEFGVPCRLPAYNTLSLLIKHSNWFMINAISYELYIKVMMIFKRNIPNEYANILHIYYDWISRIVKTNPLTYICFPNCVQNASFIWSQSMRVMKENRVDMLFLRFMLLAQIVIPNIYIIISLLNIVFTITTIEICMVWFIKLLARTFQDTYYVRTTYSFLSTEANHDRYENIVT